MLQLCRRWLVNTAATASAVAVSSSSSVAKKSEFTQPGLAGLRVAAYAQLPSSEDTGKPIPAMAIGTLVSQLSEAVFAVDFRGDSLTRCIEMGSRVYVAYEQDDEGNKGFLMGGLVIKVNPNGTLGVLLDNNKMDLAVPRSKIALSEGRCKFLNNDRFAEVVEWVRSAGVLNEEDQESTACILFHLGWRVDRLYLLEAADMQHLTHISRSARMAMMEKAEWQRDHHRQMRSIYKERVKEKDKRYLFSKYAGILSATVAFIGAFSLFGWNYKNYLKQQRSYQMKFAVKALCRKVQNTTALLGGRVHRDMEEGAVRQIFRQLDTSHPRIVVLTGYLGCGKSILCRMALEQEGMSAVFVNARYKEDTLRSVIKALGAPSVEACGDPLDFISDACLQAKQVMGGKTPVVVLKLRGGDSLNRVYNEAITLACDRRVCHIVIEVPTESLTVANVFLPRLDFYTVPNFTPKQAYQYTRRRMDPLDLLRFFNVVGTNSNDLDELFAAVHQRGASPTEYTDQKLLKAMRQLQAAWAGDPLHQAAVRRLAAFPYDDGQREGVDEASLRHPALKDIVLYNPVRDVWLFTNQIFHTAARCCL